LRLDRQLSGSAPASRIGEVFFDFRILLRRQPKSLAGISASNPVTQKKLNRRTFMLGEKIGEISGKVTMRRVLPNLGGNPKMETTFQASGPYWGQT
jgi:hypothetical protein